MGLLLDRLLREQPPEEADHQQDRDGDAEDLGVGQLQLRQLLPEPLEAGDFQLHPLALDPLPGRCLRSGRFADHGLETRTQMKDLKALLAHESGIHPITRHATPRAAAGTRHLDHDLIPRRLVPWDTPPRSIFDSVEVSRPSARPAIGGKSRSPASPQHLVVPDLQLILPPEIRNIDISPAVLLFVPGRWPPSDRDGTRIHASVCPDFGANEYQLFFSCPPMGFSIHTKATAGIRPGSPDYALLGVDRPALRGDRRGLWPGKPLILLFISAMSS